MIKIRMTGAFRKPEKQEAPNKCGALDAFKKDLSGFMRCTKLGTIITNESASVVTASNARKLLLNKMVRW